MSEPRRPFLARWQVEAEGSVHGSTRITRVRGETSDDSADHQFQSSRVRTPSESADPAPHPGTTMLSPVLAKWQVAVDGVANGSTYITKALGETSDDR